MPFRDLIVVGASAGGVEALRELVSALPPDFGGAVCVVLHISPSAPSVLHRILERSGPLAADVPADGEIIRRGRIYVAPPDRHLVVHRGYFRLIRGPRENGNRPAIDALFRSAARAYGPAVVGVILTGNLGDGSLGLREVKRRGGMAIVQSPDDALYPSMPRNAIINVEIDHVVPLDAIAPLLTELAGTASDTTSAPGAGWPPLVADTTDTPPARAQPEARDAAPPAESDAPMTDDVEETIDTRFVDGGARYNERLGGRASGYTCPECHGALWEIQEESLVRYRCRVGHSYSEPALLDHKSESLEAALWTALTTLEESAALAHRMAERAIANARPAAASRYDARAARLEQRFAVIRQVLIDIDVQAVSEDATG